VKLYLEYRRISSISWLSGHEVFLLAKDRMAVGVAVRFCRKAPSGGNNDVAPKGETLNADSWEESY
jgi:hypothetical protein